MAAQEGRERWARERCERVLPSRGEGWGRPHVEAMAMGLPVIATNWSGPTEYVNEANGYPLPLIGLIPVKEGAFKVNGK